jgi:hypothetical protein
MLEQQMIAARVELVLVDTGAIGARQACPKLEVEDLEAQSLRMTHGRPIARQAHPVTGVHRARPEDPLAEAWFVTSHRMPRHIAASG